MKTYRVAITGGRDHEITEDEHCEFVAILNQYLEDRLEKVGQEAMVGQDCELVVIHGNCRGVDRRAAEVAEQAGYPTVPFEAPWNWTYYLDGREFKAAGPLRNWMMIQAADLLIAFPGGRGTADCVRQAEKKGIEVVRISP